MPAQRSETAGGGQTHTAPAPRSLTLPPAPAYKSATPPLALPHHVLLRHLARSATCAGPTPTTTTTISLPRPLGQERETNDMATTEPGLDAVRADVASHALFTSGEPLRAGKLVGEALPALQRQASALDARVARARAELHASIRSELHDLDRILAETSAAPEHTDSIPARIAAVDADLAQLAPLFSSRGAGEAAASSAHALQADALQGQLDALDDLYAARSYYLLLARADALAQAVLAADKGQGLSADGQDGKEEALRHLIALGDLVSAAMDAWARGAGTSDEPQVLAYLRAQLVRTYDTLKHDRSAALATALSDAGWPVSMFSEENVTGQTTEPAEVRARERAILHDTHVREAWFDLCSLQRLGDGSLWPDPREREAQLLFLPPASSMSPSPDTAPPGAHEFIPLLPSWLLLQPTLQRFAYHFDTDHASNRLDKPEWWMRHLLDVLAHQLPLWHASAPALDEGSVRHLNSLGGYEGADTVQELVHVILCTARVKIEASMPALVEHPHLLAHTLFAAMDFDAELADMVAAAPTVPEHTRPAPIRLAHLILDKDEWFEAWLEGEKKHAFSTLESILSIRHAWRISLADGTADDEYNPAVTGPVLTPSGARAPLASTTICSRETVELLDHITALYRPLLPSTGDKTLLHRLAFWDQIQRPLVSTFLAALKAALDTFESASSVFARHMPGGMLGGEPLLSRPSAEEEDQSDTKASLPTRGPAGVQRLCAIYISAYYLRTSLVSWSSQGLFLELSHDLLARGILPDTFAPQSGLKGLLQRGVQSSKQVAGAFRPLSGRPTDGLDTGMGREEADVSLWSGLVEDTSALEQRAAQAIRKLVVGEVSEALVEYSRR